MKIRYRVLDRKYDQFYVEYSSIMWPHNEAGPALQQHIWDLGGDWVHEGTYED